MKLEFLADGSPDCPLIRLYEFEKAEVIHLKELLDSLANGTRLSVSLHEEPGIEPIDGCRLDLVVSSRNAGIVPKGDRIFECALDKDRWSDLAWLANPLCGSEESRRFQWLNEDGPVALLLSDDGRW